MHARFLHAKAPVGASEGFRQVHRWLAIAFTVPVIANFAAYAVGEPPAWLAYAPLPPLFLLMFTDLYLFARPCVAKWRRSRRRADGKAGA